METRPVTFPNDLAAALAGIRDGLTVVDGQRQLLVNTIERHKREVEEETALAEDWERAADLLRSFSDERSARLQAQIEDLVSRALTGVFGEKLSFRIVSRVLRGAPSVEFFVVDENGLERPPLGSHGGGLIQVVGFVLRAVVVLLSPDRHLLVLDEPFSQVSANYRPALARFVREVVDATDLQIIMVTHDTDLPEVADTHYRLRMKDGETVVQASESA